jgi:proteic killer suppression protein
MQIEYRKNKLKKQVSSPSEIKRAFGVNAKKVSTRLDEITSSPNLAVLMQIPAANCHQLTGNRKSEWGLDISKNHRIIFEIADNPVPLVADGSINTLLVTSICILEIGEDYH